jgi:nucleoside-diphosphate-sugar epimerase
LTGSKSVIAQGPEREGDVKHSMASVEKAHAAGFVPKGSMAAGLEETIQFYKHRAVAK